MTTQNVGEPIEELDPPDAIGRMPTLRLGSFDRTDVVRSWLDRYWDEFAWERSLADERERYKGAFENVEYVLRKAVDEIDALDAKISGLRACLNDVHEWEDVYLRDGVRHRRCPRCEHLV